MGHITRLSPSNGPRRWIISCCGRMYVNQILKYGIVSINWIYYYGEFQRPLILPIQPTISIYSKRAISSRVVRLAVFRLTWSKSNFPCAFPEPAFYKQGHFGVRLKNVLEVIDTEKRHPSGAKFLRFKELTLVPYEAKLIDRSLLSTQEVRV